MPSIEDWKQKNTELLDEIEKFEENPDLVSPYKILGGVAQVMIVGAGILLPQTQALKWIVSGLKLFGGFLKGYSEKRK